MLLLIVLLRGFNCWRRGFFSVFHVNMPFFFALLCKSLQCSIRKWRQSVCHLSFCKTAFSVTDNHIVGSIWHISSFPTAQSPVLIISLPLTSFGHHLITEQSRSQCFLITLPPPSGHHLMMKNLLWEIWAFVLLSFFSLFAIELCVCEWKEGVFVHNQHIFGNIFCSQAWNLIFWA